MLWPGRVSCRLLVVVGSLVVVVVAGAAYSVVRPAAAFLAEAEGGIIAASLLTTSFLAARGVAAPVAGYLGDRSPELRRFILQVLLFLMALSVAGMAVWPHPLGLALLMALWGFLSGVYWPTMQYAVSWAAGTTGLGIYFALGGLGMSVGYFVYALVSSIPAVAILLGALMLVLSACISLVFFSKRSCSDMRAPGGSRVTPAGALRAVLAPATLWVLVSSLVFGSARGLLGEFLYVYLARIHGITGAVLGGLLGVAQLVSVAGSFIAGYLADRAGLVRVLAAILVVNAVGLLLVGNTLSATLAAIGVVVAHFTVSASMPLTRNILVARDPSYAGTVIGLSNTVSNIGGALAPVVGALVYTAVGDAVAYKGLVFIALAVSSLLLAVLRPREP